MGSFIYRRIAQSSAIYGAGIVAARLASFVLLPVYTRFLTTADYGTLELLDTTLYVFALLFGGRFAEALFYHYSLAGTEHEKSRILSTITTGAWLIGGLGMMVGLLLAPWVSRIVFQDPDYVRYFRIVFVTFGIGIPAEVGFARLRAMDRPGLYVAASLARLCLTLGVTIYLVVFQQWRVWGVLVSNLAVTLLLAAALTVATFWSRGIQFSTTVFVKTLRFALPLGVSGIGLFLIHFGDRYFLQRYAGLAEIGIYALAYKLGMLVSQVHLAFGTYWTAQGYNTLRSSEAPEIFTRLNTYLMAVVVWAGLAITVFTPPVLAIVAAPPYAPAAKFVPWLVLAYVVRVEADYFRFTLYLDGSTGKDAAIVWVAAGLCLAGYWVLIPSYQLWGAVASTLLAFLSLMILAYGVAIRRLGYRLQWRRLAHLAITAVLLGGTNHWFDAGGAWQSWAIAGLVTLCYPAILAGTGFLTADEGKQLFSVLPRWRKRR